MPARLIAAVCLLGVFAASLPASSLAQAQQPRVHGPWLGAGLGTASARVNCEICANDRNGGLSGYLTGGLTITRGLRAGAEVAGWFDTTDEVKQSLALYGASLYIARASDPRAARAEADVVLDTLISGLLGRTAT